jgi:hypothetical protein
MPVPPVESISRSSRAVPPAESISRRSMPILETEGQGNEWFTFYGIITIFFASFVELISIGLRGSGHEVLEASNHVYLIKTYPLLMQVIVFVFALFFLANISKMKNCIYSKLVIYMYFTVQSINLLFIIFSFGIQFYDAILYPLLIATTLIMGSLKFILKK